MRGTLGSGDETNELSGITPAYAGNTTSSNYARQHGRDHPRVCGEHCITSLMTAKPSGSPPRMRGTPEDVKEGWYWFGITPAYAGNTKRRQKSAFLCWDHPRVCGEH